MMLRIVKGQLSITHKPPDTELQAAQAKLNELNGQSDALMSELKVP
ncbi:MAG TPA: hypothetical protein VE135_24510 [Pyrinomonadaceae bacterium]|nr:hypothetical protein [Pyrinomonadaceae bacterium]